MNVYLVGGTDLLTHNLQYSNGVTEYTLRKQNTNDLSLFETPVHESPANNKTTFHEVLTLIVTKDHEVKVSYSGAIVQFVYRGDSYEQVEKQTDETEHKRAKNTAMKTGFLFKVLPNHWEGFLTKLQEWAEDKNINLDLEHDA
jgi:hypothetical protein